jgi:hypothetical protein
VQERGRRKRTGKSPMLFPVSHCQVYDPSSTDTSLQLGGEMIPAAVGFSFVCPRGYLCYFQPIVAGGLGRGPTTMRVWSGAV